MLLVVGGGRLVASAGGRSVVAGSGYNRRMDLYQGTIRKRDRRAFLPQAIGAETLHRILQAGRMTPSSKNVEPNRFVVVDDAETRQQLAALSPIAGWLADAPVIIAIVQTQEHQFDAGRAAQNMMLAAYNEGIGSCPAHLPEERVAELLGIPGDLFPNRVIGFGVIDPARDRPPRAVARKRLPMEDLVHTNHW